METDEANESSELFQSLFWVRFKQQRGYPTQTFHVELPREHQNASLLVIQRPCGGSSLFGYVPYGPDIRRAFRNNVSACAGGAEYLDQWYSLYANTADRKGFVCEDFSYFRRLFETAAGFFISGAVGTIRSIRSRIEVESRLRHLQIHITSEVADGAGSGCPSVFTREATLAVCSGLPIPARPSLR